MREIFDFDKLKTFVTGKPVKMRIDSMNGGNKSNRMLILPITKYNLQ